MALLHYRAGPRAAARIRREGLSAAAISTLIAPAAGPKWLAVAGLDRALLASGWLRDRVRPLIVAGASAGAWRGAALAAAEPEAAYQRLQDAYIGQHFVHADSSRRISAAYRALLQEVLSAVERAHLLQQSDVALRICTCRVRGWAGAERRILQLPALGVAYAFNALSRRSQRLSMERVYFEHAPANLSEAQRAGLAKVDGRRVQLSADNLLDALLASGSVPLYMAPVRNPAGAPEGRYLDGGLTDYHISQPPPAGGDVALMFLHQRRLIPAWFDKALPYRKPTARDTDDLLLVHPSEDFVRSLPGGQVPTREDFERFVNAPDERMERWRTAAAATDALGQEWLADVRSGAVAGRLEPL